MVGESLQRLGDLHPDTALPQSTTLSQMTLSPVEVGSPRQSPASMILHHLLRAQVLDEG